jgi:hypothetical protein
LNIHHQAGKADASWYTEPPGSSGSGKKVAKGWFTVFHNPRRTLRYPGRVLIDFKVTQDSTDSLKHR